MIRAIKLFIRPALLPILYGGGIIIMLISIFKDAKWGLFLLIFMIPMPNLWQKFYMYPLGGDYIDLLYLSVILGMFFQGKITSRSNNLFLIFLFIFYSYLSLWNCSFKYSLPLPISGANHFLYQWKNYAQMIFLYVIVLNTVKDEDQQKTIVILMALVVLFISFRAFRNFSGGASFDYDKRYGGPFEAVGLGANHFGAFIAHYCSMFFGMFLLDNNKKRKYLFLATFLLGLHPLFFTYSRGAYLAAFAVIAFYGITKKKFLIVMIILFLISWQLILPESVVDRITMTRTEDGEIEGSAAHRFKMWSIAFELFEKNPIFGSGYGSYRFNVPEDEELKDTHNFMVRILCEQGIIGLSLLLFLLLKAFMSGWRLLKIGNTSFSKAFGFGFMGCTLAIIITNLFGDRFSYFVLGSYFFILWGMVDKSILIINESEKHKNIDS